MLAKELAALLMQTPDVRVTVAVWDGDSFDEHDVDGVSPVGNAYLSIDHS